MRISDWSSDVCSSDLGVVSVDYYHSSKVRSSDNILPAYDVFNARLDLKGIGGSSVDAGVFVRNLFDKEYLASSNVGSAVLGINSSFYGAPRTYGIELRSEEHTSELQSLMRIPYAIFCWNNTKPTTITK